MSELLDAALGYAARGWPVGAVRPAGKVPLTRHGVQDFTTDSQLLERWWSRWPDANVAIACGTPGPQVLDVDDLEQGRWVLELAARAHTPLAATGRGRHAYFAGQPRGTVALPYGELRGHGSYVVAPPSLHPSGKLYVWLAEPAGPLPPPPPLAATSAGQGDHQPPAGPVPYHQRHPYLRDFAVRLVRAGVTDPEKLRAHLELEFGLACEPSPAPAPRSFETLARWAARTRIAERERRTDG